MWQNQLKKQWGTIQKVLGSKSRLEKIVFDILKDFKGKTKAFHWRRQCYAGIWKRLSSL